MNEIVQLQKVDEKSVTDINILFTQLSPDHAPVSLPHLEKMLAHPDIEIWTVRDGEHIVGIATLLVIYKLSGVSALIEHVVVDEKYRGKGLGEALVKKLIERARERGVKAVALTSRSSRTAANKLYQKLGFVLRDTNAYRLEL